VDHQAPKNTNDRRSGKRTDNRFLGKFERYRGLRTHLATFVDGEVGIGACPDNRRRRNSFAQDKSVETAVTIDSSIIHTTLGTPRRAASDRLNSI
jgi:hypothetical protein